MVPKSVAFRGGCFAGTESSGCLPHPLHVCSACRHIVKYLGFGHDEPKPTDSETQVPAPSCTYLVQEYLESGTLKSLVLKQVCESQ